MQAENAVVPFWRAVMPLRLHSRNLPALIEIESVASMQPVPWTCDQGQALLPVRSAAPSRRGGQRMIPPQPPSRQIFIRAQPMLCVDMPTQRFPSEAAVEANHILVADRLPYRNSRSVNFLRLKWRSKLTKCSMYQCDEFWNLTGYDCMVPHVALDDRGGELWIDLWSVHGSF